MSRLSRVAQAWVRVWSHRNRPTPTVLDLLSWNLKDGRKAADVVRDVVTVVDQVAHPHVLVFQESRRYATALRRALHGYKLVMARGWDESSNVLVFVRHDVPLARWRALRMNIGWVGPKAFRRHVGRTFLVVDLGREWRVVGVHMPPGGPTGGTVTHGRNKPAYTEASHEVQRVNARRGSYARALVDVGDWNADAGDSHLTAPAAIATNGDLQLVRAGGGPDYALVRGCRGVGHRGTYLGSDHPYRTFTLTRTQEPTT